MPKKKKEPIRLETGMMDQIMLVYGTGPVETWEVMRVWHASQREEAEEYLRFFLLGKPEGIEMKLVDTADGIPQWEGKQK